MGEQVKQIVTNAIAWHFAETDTPEMAADAVLKALADAGIVLCREYPPDEQAQRGGVMRSVFVPLSDDSTGEGGGDG